MPKKKTSKSDTVPEWFPKLSDTAPYSTVQVAHEEVEDWLDDFAQGYRNPDAWQEVERCFQQLFAFQDRHKSTLAEVEWSQYSSHQLIWWAVAELTLRRAIEGFLPSPYDQLSQSVRAWLYLFQLIVTGIAEAAKPQIAHPDPLELARRAIHVRLAAPYAKREIQRRVKQHVGSPVGELLFWRGIDAMSEQGSLLQTIEGETLVQEIMDKLRACSWRKTKRRVSRVVNDETLVAETLKAQLSMEIYEAIVKRWGGLEGLDVLARSLDGECNIVPTAVADSVMDPRRLRELFPFLDEWNNVHLPMDKDDSVILVRRREGEREYKPSRITLSITEEDDAHPGSSKKQADQVLADFLKRYPEHADGIQLLLSDEPLKNLARARGRTVQTIINRKMKALEALKKFAKGGLS